MPKDDLLLYKLEEIDRKLTSIESKLEAGHVRMDKHGDDILKLNIAKAFIGKQMAGVWCICLLAIAAFLNSYFQAQYIKPKNPVAPIRAAAVK